MNEPALPAVPPVHEAIRAEALARHATLTKPPGSLGRLERLGVQIAAIQGNVRPRIERPAVAVFAADHGVAEEGVSAYPKSVTQAMLRNFASGGAAINALARAQGAKLLVVDVGVDGPRVAHERVRTMRVRDGTRNFSREAALTTEELHAALRAGAEIARELTRAGTDLVVGGEMGIANTTAAAAVTAAFTGESVERVTGRGTGIDELTLRTKRTVIERALALHDPPRGDPLEVLRTVGGLEIAALTGFYLEAAAARAVVVLDGFIATAAALAATRLEPNLRAYLVASHLSREPGHAAQLDALELEPLLRLDLALGEGSGGALAIGIIRSAAAVLAEMATFEEAGI